MRGILIKAIAFACLARAQRDENEEKNRSDPLVDPNFYIDQLKAIKEKTRSAERILPSKIPVVLDNDHTYGNWTSNNFTDSCSYVEQPDGSILINSMHRYSNNDYCHEYWECENPNHNMFFKWNRVKIEYGSDCKYDWARVAWGSSENEQEVICDDWNELSDKQKAYRDTGGNKIVWDFDTNDEINSWGVEAQIICKDPLDVDECVDGTHDCEAGAECVKESGKAGFKCQCPSGGIKWGDKILKSTGSGTISDPCKYSHPDFPTINLLSIEWDGEPVGVMFENKKITWQDAFNRCNELGMTLPIPSNKRTNKALANFLHKSNHKRIFLGAHNSNNEREWVNLYTNKRIVYNQWSYNQPDNAGNAEKVAEMWQNDGDWNDLTLTHSDYRGLLCIKVDYEDWSPEDINMGNFFCETGLNQCHMSAVCRESSSDNDYECECDDVDIEDITLTPVNDRVSYGQACTYTLPGRQTEVQTFIYDGKSTVYHMSGEKQFYDAFNYCAKLGMHLPVPNTDQQYEDLKVIPRYDAYSYYSSFWLGYTDGLFTLMLGHTDKANQGTWLNIYNGEELAINKWRYGHSPQTWKDQAVMQQYDDFSWIESFSVGSSSTLCLMTNLKANLDFCGTNFHDCSSEATCTNSGSSYTCTCPQAKIGDWDVEPASTSTGQGPDGCHYFHPNFDGHRIFRVNYGGRDTAVYLGPAAGSNFYDYAAKCKSLGMRMLTPENNGEGSSVYQLRNKPGGLTNMQVPLGVTRRYDGQWRNIYTYNKAWTSWSSDAYSFPSDYDLFGNRDFAYANFYYSSSNWYGSDFGSPTNARTICIALQDGESTDIDFCGTGFNDCHEGASCTNGGDAGYTCECQPIQFGDVEVKPIDFAGTGKSCTYKMPGHDDKTIFPVRVRSNSRSDLVYAFHSSKDSHLLKDAIMYCGALGMHLPLPMNKKENFAMKKVLPGQNMNKYWLGISDYGENLKYVNIYTGEEPSYTNWDVNQPKAGASYTNVGINRDNGKWATYTDSTMDNRLRTICQKGGVDVSKFDWCAAGLHDCHVDSNCMPSNDDNTPYICKCKDPEFYVGNGIGENGCVFKFGSKFFIDNYNVDVSINDRYARTQIAVSVANKNTNSAELYEFGVNLDDFEFISGLTIRMGDDGAVSVGDVHKEQEAEEIFETVISSGSGGAITEIKPTDVNPEATNFRNTTFSVKVNVPAGKKLYIWLNYDMQLTRRKAFYAYTTNVFPYDAVSKMKVSVTLEESRNIDAEKTAVYWESEDKPNSQRAVRNQENEFTSNKAGSKKWEFLFEKEFIDAEQWNDNLKIEYDLERLDNTCGDIVMRDGYFIHYIAPKGLGSIPKNVILTVDTSGSMGWTRMNNAKAAMITILESLTDQDTFWLQQFNSFTSAWTSDTVQATASNIENAKRWVDSLTSGGGTALYSAINNSVQRPLDMERANLAFIISDGYPTSGITKWSDIQANILAENSIKDIHGDEVGQKWAIYNFGIGNGAPMFELSKLSTWNMGVGRQVFDDADVHSQLTEFFNEYSIPLVWNNQFHYGGASEYDCSGTNLYADQELTCIGKLPSNNKCGNVEDLGFTPGNTLLAGVDMMNNDTCKIVSDAGCSSDNNDAQAYDKSDLMANPNPKSPKPNLAKVFAYQQMQRKLRLYHDSYVQEVKDALKADIEEFAIINDFVTEFTTLVVVEATRRSRPVDGVVIKKRRSREKKHKLKELFSEYKEEVKRLKAIEQAEIDAVGGLKNMERPPEIYAVIEKPYRENNQKRARVRREALTGSAFNLRLFGALVMISSVIAVLPIRREVQRLRNLF